MVKMMAITEAVGGSYTAEDGKVSLKKPCMRKVLNLKLSIGK